MVGVRTTTTTDPLVTLKKGDSFCLSFSADIFPRSSVEVEERIMFLNSVDGDVCGYVGRFEEKRMRGRALLRLLRGRRFLSLSLLFVSLSSFSLASSPDVDLIIFTEEERGD
jgi:hypothetical protein